MKWMSSPRNAFPSTGQREVSVTPSLPNPLFDLLNVYFIVLLHNLLKILKFSLDLLLMYFILMQNFKLVSSVYSYDIEVFCIL